MAWHGMVYIKLRWQQQKYVDSKNKKNEGRRKIDEDSQSMNV